MSLRKRRRAEKKPVRPLDPTLQESMLRMGARGPLFFGWVLAHLRDAHGLAAEEQAARLGLSAASLAVLAMCKVPRPDRLDEDLATVAAHVGVGVKQLARVLREAAALNPGS